MRLSVALRVVAIVVAVKAVLIGVVYWRRAELIGRQVDLGTVIVVALIAVAVLGIAIAAALRFTNRS